MALKTAPRSSTANPPHSSRLVFGVYGRGTFANAPSHAGAVGPGPPVGPLPPLPPGSEPFPPSSEPHPTTESRKQPVKKISRIIRLLLIPRRCRRPTATLALNSVARDFVCKSRCYPADVTREERAARRRSNGLKVSCQQARPPSPLRWARRAIEGPYFAVRKMHESSEYQRSSGPRASESMERPALPAIVVLLVNESGALVMLPLPER